MVRLKGAQPLPSDSSRLGWPQRLLSCRYVNVVVIGPFPVALFAAGSRALGKDQLGQRGKGTLLTPECVRVPEPAY